MHTPSRLSYVDGLRLHAATPSDDFIDARPYQRAVGVVRYLVDGTRPDLAVKACDLARVLHQQTKRHWLAAQQVARYQLHSTHTCLQYKSGDCILRAQANDAFAVGHAQRWSTM